MIVLNGQLQAAEAAAISPLIEGFQLGAGVFTTIRVRRGRAEFLERHAARLSRDARVIGLAEASGAGVLAGRCAECVAANAIAYGGVKVVWFADAGGRTGEIISPRTHAYGEAAVARGFRLMTMRCEARGMRALSRHKTLNYLEHAQAKRAAVAAGFDEALWVDADGCVLEGATTNVFAVFRDEIVTPEVSGGLLPGVVREVVLAQASLSRPVREAVLTRERLMEAEEIFITNALMGVMPVRGWDKQIFDGARAAVTREVALAFDRVALGISP